jgi:predicted 3-demethylubiquinone-9 3-methyltransferase (glyoxalase superfamily)
MFRSLVRAPGCDGLDGPASSLVRGARPSSTSTRRKSMAQRQRITTFLWFDGNAEQAVKHYTSIFRNSKVLSVARCGDAGPGPEGSVLTITFRLEGQEFMALNGGPGFPFTQAVSLLVRCDTQAEVDTLWRKLSAGGEKVACGWLRDRFGLSWQVTPTVLLRMIEDPDPARSARAMKAMMKMRKLDIAKLQKAYAGK